MVELAIVASIVPFAMLGNVARVSITVALVSSQGIEFAQGLLHQNLGIATFVLGTFMLLILAKVLR